MTSADIKSAGPASNGLNLEAQQAHSSPRKRHVSAGAEKRPLRGLPTLPDVDARLRLAKHRISLAALACLRGAHDAAAQVARALAEVEAARNALKRIQAMAPTPDEENEA